MDTTFLSNFWHRQLCFWDQKDWPILYACRPTIARIFQLNGNKSETAQDIDLKISAFAHHMSGVNWHKNFSHCSISRSVAPSSMQKFCTPLGTLFVEKKFEKNFGVVLHPFELPHERNFWYFEKNGVLKFFERVWNPEPVIHRLNMDFCHCLPQLE